jgi:hypothetical protein
VRRLVGALGLKSADKSAHSNETLDFSCKSARWYAFITSSATLLPFPKQKQNFDGRNFLVTRPIKGECT